MGVKDNQKSTEVGFGGCKVASILARVNYAAGDHITEALENLSVFGQSPGMG